MDMTKVCTMDVRGGEGMKIIRVDHCWGCPWHDFKEGCCGEDLDERPNRKILNTWTIPDWCPLEEVKDVEG